MSTPDSNEETETVTLSLPLSRESVAWLSRMSQGNDYVAAEMIASMIDLIREDDEQAHKMLN